LAVTAVSVAALVGAGFSSYGDPDLAGRAALARLSGEVASGVVAEWEQLRRGPSPPGDEPVLWSTNPAPVAQPVMELERDAGHVVAEALLSEARRLDQEEDNPAAALDVVLEVFGKEPDDARRVEARLRAIQLAVRCERLDVAAEQWALARTELSGDEALAGVSALLLCALAAAPALSIEERAPVRDDLVTLWIAGELALPAASFAKSPLREAYRQRLQALLPGSMPDPRLEQFILQERARALEELAGRPAPPPTDGGLGVLAIGERELIYRRRDADTVVGRFEKRGATADRLGTAIEAANLLPEGFAIDFDGTDESAGVIVRELVPLSFAPRGFVVRHADPDSIVSAVSERQALLRTALFVLAAGVAAAGFSVFRALRRERHLADLKSAFVANVSHELRTPVSSILLMAENLEDERIAGAETRRRYHHLIRREAERLRRLVDDVLDFSRIERGKGVHLSMSDIDVLAFARELEAEARERVTGADGELTCAVNGIPRHIVADADALRRATMNLVDNALRHSGVSDVDLQLGSDGQDGLLIQVRDRGRGVPGARLESLFRPFERLGPADGVAGTGLGLAIVREIAEGHGGSATAHRPEGPGLAFEIRVPAQPGKEKS